MIQNFLGKEKHINEFSYLCAAFAEEEAKLLQAKNRRLVLRENISNPFLPPSDI